MSIRKAVLADLKTVQQITETTISAIYPHYYPKGAVEFFLKHHSEDKIRVDIEQDRVFLCLDDAQTVAGTVTVKRNEICRLFVLPAWQGRGYGTELLNYAEEVVSERYPEIELAASLPAKSIYQKRGYAQAQFNLIAACYGDFLCYDVMKKQGLKNMTVNGKEYKILKLLGKGKGGYSYLASDGAKSYVLKQIHHEPCDYYQFGNKIESEVTDYKRLEKIGIRIPAMLDVDMEHERILKEFIDGDTIYNLILQDKMEPAYLDQVQGMCALLYAVRLNIDYFPTNFVVKNGEIYYIDFECSEYMDEWNFENWGVKYWAKTPEFLKYVEDCS